MDKTHSEEFMRHIREKNSHVSILFSYSIDGINDVLRVRDLDF